MAQMIVLVNPTGSGALQAGSTSATVTATLVFSPNSCINVDDASDADEMVIDANGCSGGALAGGAQARFKPKLTCKACAR